MDITDRYHSLSTTLYPWFNDQWQKIIDLHSANKLPHALIINGVQGVGKLHFASRFAQFMLCQDKQAQAACQYCRSCQLFLSSGHPDLYHLAPAENTDQIKVDQVRDLGQFMQSTALQGGYRVVILEPAEAMNVASANALLKTLEEPGKNSLLLLISHQLGQVMPTIKSRCQRIDCAVPNTELASSWLQQQLSIEQATANQLLSVVHGAPLKALSFKEEGAQALRSEFFIALRTILQKKATALEVAPKFMKNDISMLLAWLYSLLVDVSKIYAVNSDVQIVNADMKKMIGAIAERSQIKKVYQLLDKVQQQRSALLAHQNPNKQLLLEDVLLDWGYLI